MTKLGETGLYTGIQILVRLTTITDFAESGGMLFPISEVFVFLLEIFSIWICEKGYPAD